MLGKKKKVFVGMSGGVDSSVAAALLQKRGFDVTGVFIKVWQPEAAGGGAHTGAAGEQCTWKDDRLDAMRVAAHLDIPFMTLDLENEYKQGVIDYMVREYKEGRTPNPDVMCNKRIKFGAFFKKAMEMGADYVAMGHYARIGQENDSVALLAGVDANKDQSYFLWTLAQKELQKTLFPIGEYQKSEVREMARKFGLPTAEKKDSQGLCFVGKLDMKEFLKDFIPKKKGEVVNEKGEVIGSHDGAYFYTRGQRHGFTVTAQTAEDAPLYVVAKYIEKNTLIVSHRSLGGELPLGKKEMSLREVNWIGEKPVEGKRYGARFRYRQKLLECMVSSLSQESALAHFDEPQTADIGQSLVLYDGEICLGGGVIA